MFCKSVLDHVLRNILIEIMTTRKGFEILFLAFVFYGLEILTNVRLTRTTRSCWNLRRRSVSEQKKLQAIGKEAGKNPSETQTVS